MKSLEKNAKCCVQANDMEGTKNDSMVLFHAITIYQLMICICLRMENARHKMAICILPDFIRSKFPGYKALEQYGLFDRVLLYPYEKMPLTRSMEVIEKAGDALYRQILSCPLEAFDEVYCGGTQFPFASYLVAKKRQFHFIEECSGTWRDLDGFREAHRRFHPDMYFITEKNGLYDGSSPYIDRMYLDVRVEDMQVDFPFDTNRVVPYNLVEKLRNRSTEESERIRRCFGLSDKEIPNFGKSTLFLTDHAANLNLLTLDEQIRRNVLTADYFSNHEELIIKPHPHDLAPYRYFFPGAVILPRLFPSELLMSLVEEGTRIAQVVSFGSAAVHNISACETVDLYGSYQKGGYRRIHRIYGVFELYRWMGNRMPCTFLSFEEDQKIFRNLGMDIREVSEVEDYEIALDGRERVFMFVPSGKEKTVNLRRFLSYPGRMAVMEDLTDDGLDILREESCHFLFKRMEIAEKKDKTKTCEYIYILTSDVEMESFAKEFQYRKDLWYRGASVEVKPWRAEVDETESLRQILHATERRLTRALVEREERKNMLQRERSMGS